MKKLDGYIRVSSINGRSGASFISPDVQRETIERVAAAKGHEVDEIVTELDVSGSKRVDDRELERLIERVERGESAGVVVWKLSRFSRSLAGAVETATRITRAGGRLIADDFDSAQPMGKALLGLLAGLAEEELDDRREGWAQARSRAVARGVPNGRAPFGYRKDRSGRLEVVPREAAIVRDAFERRAAGEAYSAIGRRFGWSHSTTRQRLSDEAYIGVARSGAYRNEDAHEAIVSHELFDAARVSRTSARPTGETTADRLLVGIARCAGCERTLKTVRRKRADGSYVVSYFCKDAGSDPCPERAYVHADALDAYIAGWFEDVLASDSRFVEAVEAAQELDDARGDLAAAEAELIAFVETASALDAALFAKGAEARQKRVDLARQAVAVLASQARALPLGGPIATVWDGLDTIDRRAVLAGYLERVVVSRGASSNLAGSVAVVWADGTIADTEQRTLVEAA